VLLGLRLHNIALIDRLELTFEKGFTVLTGETGAGKSILLDALDALFCGNQAIHRARLLRSGCKIGQIEANFSRNKIVDSWLASEGFDLDDEDLLISREWRFKEDRLVNRCRINGVVINRHQVASLRPLLIDLTFQGQIHHLSSSSNQLRWLDLLGSELIKKQLCDVQNHWDIWHKVFSELQEAKSKKDEFLQKSLELDNLFLELDAADLSDPEEDKKLEIEESRLVNAVKLQEGLSSILFRLDQGSDEFPPVLDQIGSCIQELKIMANLDPSVDKYLNNAFDFHSNLQDLTLDLHKYGSHIEIDSSKLNSIQNRLNMLKKLIQKYGLNLSQLIERREDLYNSQMSNDIENIISDLESKEELARQNRDSSNLALTNSRRKIANKFEENLMKYLRLLGLLNVRFKIEINASVPNSNGADCVRFMFSANPGECLEPLVEVASGGEMSRFLLALKTVLSNVDGCSTLLFDEIDTGVSGRISAAIANVLKDLSINRQVFCVTHQPLVAAVADHHFRVVKSVKNGITRSTVSQLHELRDRQRELAELAGGDFEEARVYAASLLDHQAA